MTRTDSPPASVTILDGHVAASVNELALLPHDLEMLSFSASTQIYPGLEHFVRTSFDLVLKWAKHHKISLRADQCLEFVNDQWPLHLHSVSNAAFTWTEIFPINKLLKTWRYIARIISRTTYNLLPCYLLERTQEQVPGQQCLQPLLCYS